LPEGRHEGSRCTCKGSQIRGFFEGKGGHSEQEKNQNARTGQRNTKKKKSQHDQVGVELLECSAGHLKIAQKTRGINGERMMAKPEREGGRRVRLKPEGDNRQKR